jgi:hypothetical protein
MNISIEEHKAIYQEFVNMHDLVLDLIDSIEEDFSDNPEFNQRIKERRLALCLPIINQFETALADVNETYVKVLQENRKANMREVKNLEKQIRGVFIAIAEYTKNLESMEPLAEKSNV